METLKNDLSNTEQLLDTYKQQCESLSDRLRQEQARHREVNSPVVGALCREHTPILAVQQTLSVKHKQRTVCSNMSRPPYFFRFTACSKYE